jgi:hypothetical protein
VLHRTRLLLSCLALGGLAVPAATAAGAPVATAAKSCETVKYPGSGYFTSLRVTGVSCGTGRKVMRAHYDCRTKDGRKGRCHRRVLRFRCSEERRSIPTEFNARVTCKRGARRVVYTYQQNT